MLMTAPMSSPPALAPLATSARGSAQPESIKWDAAAMKSVKEFVLCSIRPCSYHERPSSPPPRTWAMANETPRSRRLSLGTEKVGSMVTS